MNDLPAEADGSISRSWLEKDQVSQEAMSNARDLINAHLYPVLATAGTIFLAIGMVNAIQVNQKMSAMEEEAKYFNHCIKAHIEENPKYLLDEIVVHCNGSYREPKTSLAQ